MGKLTLNLSLSTLKQVREVFDNPGTAIVNDQQYCQIFVIRKLNNQQQSFGWWFIPLIGQAIPQTANWEINDRTYGFLFKI